MGQRTIAIMYAAEAPDDVKFFPRDTPIIAAFEPRKVRRLRPDYSWPDGDKLLVGYWLAKAGSGVEGIPYLGAVQFDLRFIDEVPELAARLKIARAGFVRLRAWLSKHGVMLGEPGLWLTETETA